MSDRLAEFRRFRESMNERILDADHREIKRFFALDARAYEEGALDVKTKELLGGSIVIPHLRRAVATLDDLNEATGAPAAGTR